ncbi:MAG: T9SS type A sorting domain-containing protein, partial [Muribaculaceae bacterium]|nr:T9SS type A sorting domain-containing protein [Muribaculaceae bacterium]
DGSEYASRFRFVPSSPFVVKNVNVIVSKAVSYAGVAMLETFEQDFNLEKEVESIKAPAIKEIEISGSGTIDVTILPAEAASGKILNVAIDSPIAQIPTSVMINSEGKAKVEVIPELFGASNVTFTVEGVNGVKGVTLLRLLSEEQVSGVGSIRGESSLRIIETADGNISISGVNSLPTVIEVFDLTGKRIMPVKHVSDDCILNVGTLSPGVVVIKAVNNKEAVTAKIMVTR